MKKNKGSFKFSLAIVVLIFIGIVPAGFLSAQEINLEITPSPTLENAQMLSLTGLGIDEKGSGPVLISAILENLTDEYIDNLFIEVTINAASIGNIVELEPERGRSFSLDPRQTVYATNNDLANEAIPGIEERIIFSGGLTPEGDDFLESISGATLPRDTYTIEVIVFRAPLSGGRQDLARSVAEIGGAATSISTFTESEIYLKTPGDVTGTEAEITNPFPQFSWEGSTGATYRLLVVEDNGQDSPESLLQSAESSSPLSEGGSLLQFENLDEIIQGTSFQFPSSGVQPLESGQTYYWRVLTTVQTGGDTEEVSSEIWNFTLISGSEMEGVTSISDEIQLALVELMGEDAYMRLDESGFTLEAIEYDGQEFTGPAAAIKLEELLQKIRDEEIILGEN